MFESGGQAVARERVSAAVCGEAGLGAGELGSPGLSAPERASGEEAFDMVVPAMLVSDFSFNEVTLF